MGSMFCYQCEQTALGTGGCTEIGNCGKDPVVAALQDVLLHLAVGASSWAHRAAALGARDPSVDVAVVAALFTTVTNVNFDPDRLAAEIAAMAAARDRARDCYRRACAAKGAAAEVLSGAATFQPAKGVEALVAQGEALAITSRLGKHGKDLAGLQELLTYGVKGAAAYAEHARILGHEDPGLYAFFHEALAYLAKPDPTVEELFALCMRCGTANLRTMEVLDAAHTGAYGHPVPTPVRVTPRKGKAIVVSGHDLKDLEALLEQTAGKGIQVYTHGEMLPAHGYPGLKKYPHLVGNYGGAWQDQQEEFDDFPGAVLMTTNCIQKPRDGYKARIFTSGLVAWPGVRHIADGNFAPVIEAALAAPGFSEDGADKTILVGFGRNAVLGVADKVIEAVKSGALRHFFLVGGCDGARSGRNYYTHFVESVPKDCVVLTLACGKFRFNALEMGDIGGIPRLLDVGQCNDAYSAIQIALALAKAFGTDVNGLPLSLVLSWYEQKAVAILLTLLSLGVKNIRLGPTLPAFVTPAVLDVLVQKFGLKAITKPATDLAEILAPKRAAAA
ncbi:MAG TPA: hydroxylamine reductase [Anaeromyxobacteraceae bacterium]|nr:hydroxylamine reductase [Anaeromyxobacteraceae bacterium]